MMVLQLLFWVSAGALLHSYVLYPLLLRMLASGKKPNVPPALTPDAIPQVHVLMAAYNEEAVIGEKLDNLLALDYPADKLHIWVGSDNSTDGTNAILEAYAQQHARIRVQVFRQRTGKIGIQNRLFQGLHLQPNDLLLLTDADVLLAPDAVRRLAEQFQDARVGLAAANPLNKSAMATGVSHLERTYIQGENNTKYFEGLLWGTMMGAFGACYMLRASLYKPVPENFKVDDFFITMSVLRDGYQAIKVPQARCFEDSPDDMDEEYRRKVRISTGNFQNLRYFAGIMWPPFRPLGFAFLSHKVMRWLGPFFLVAAYLTSTALWDVNVFYHLAFLVQNILLFLTVIDVGLRKSGIQSIPLRFVTYFYYMNLALLVGFYKFLKGEQTNVWEPTKRKR